MCLEGTTSSEVNDALGMTLLRMADKSPPAAGTADRQVVSGIGQAGCLVGQKKYDEAKTQIASLTSKYPQFPNIHYASGLLLLDTGDTSNKAIPATMVSIWFLLAVGELLVVNRSPDFAAMSSKRILEGTTWATAGGWKNAMLMSAALMATARRYFRQKHPRIDTRALDSTPSNAQVRLPRR